MGEDATKRLERIKAALQANIGLVTNYEDGLFLVYEVIRLREDVDQAEELLHALEVSLAACEQFKRERDTWRDRHHHHCRVAYCAYLEEGWNEKDEG